MTNEQSAPEGAAAELLPCPFCGAYSPSVKESIDGNPRRHLIWCTECPGRAEYFSSPIGIARAHWNRRAADRDARTEATKAEPVGWAVESSEEGWYGTKLEYTGPMLPVGTRVYATPPSADSVRFAAQALVDRWDTPLWKDAPHTGEFIQRLREALAE